MYLRPTSPLLTTDPPFTDLLTLLPHALQLHPFCQQKEIVDYCKKSGILVEAYCPLVRGSFGDPVLQALCKKVMSGTPHKKNDSCKC